MLGVVRRFCGKQPAALSWRRTQAAAAAGGERAPVRRQKARTTLGQRHYARNDSIFNRFQSTFCSRTAIHAAAVAAAVAPMEEEKDGRRARN